MCVSDKIQFISFAYNKHVANMSFVHNPNLGFSSSLDMKMRLFFTNKNAIRAQPVQSSVIRVPLTNMD